MAPTIRIFAALVLAIGLVAPAPVGSQGLPAATPPPDAEWARVVHVTDGDTIRVDRGAGADERLRYIGIDTPETVHPSEPVEPWGPEASAANERLVAGREVLLERDVSDHDRYDRLLRYVWVQQPDGWRMVNAELVALGLAEVRAYEPDTRHDAWLRQVEDEARAAGLGIHAPEGDSPVPLDSPAPAADDGRGLLEDLLDFLFGRSRTSP